MMRFNCPFKRYLYGLYVVYRIVGIICCTVKQTSDNLSQEIFIQYQHGDISCYSLRTGLKTIPEFLNMMRRTYIFFSIYKKNEKLFSKLSFEYRFSSLTYIKIKHTITWDVDKPNLPFSTIKNANNKQYSQPLS